MNKADPSAADITPLQKLPCTVPSLGTAQTHYLFAPSLTPLQFISLKPSHARLNLAECSCLFWTLSLQHIPYVPLALFRDFDYLSDNIDETTFAYGKLRWRKWHLALPES